MCRRALGTGALIGALGCVAADEPLPPVHRSDRLEQASEPCLLPPPPLPIRRPLRSQPTDPGRCLEGSLTSIMNRVPPLFRRDSLPVALSISSDGKITDVSFYDSCAGVKYPVDATTAACIRRSLAEWRYEPNPTSCDESRYLDQAEIELSPPAPRRSQAARLFRAGACG